MHTLVISTPDRKLSLCRFHDLPVEQLTGMTMPSTLAQNQTFVRQVVPLTPFASIDAKSTVEEVYRQPAYSPFGDLLAVTCYQNTPDQPNPASMVIIKRMKSSNGLDGLIGHDLIRIKTERISFYHYWSSDGMMICV